MIKTFSDRDTEALFLTGRSRRLPVEIWRSGLRALRALDAATSLSDLRGEGRRLEAFGNGHTVRVNDKYRVFFVWRERDAFDVRIFDPH